MYICIYIYAYIVWTRSRTGDISYAGHPYSLFVRFDYGVKSELPFLFDVKSIDLSFSFSELTLLTTGLRCNVTKLGSCKCRGSATICIPLPRPRSSNTPPSDFGLLCIMFEMCLVARVAKSSFNHTRLFVQFTHD